jgi:predicted alpha/beta superfamily hydrolase
MSAVRAETQAMRDVESWDVVSALGWPFRISVALPASYAASTKRYPVLYILDADVFFATAVEQARLQGMVGEIGEVIVVGIGYPPGADVRVVGARRTFEMSATDQWDPQRAVDRDMAAVFKGLGMELKLGGAPAFLDFIDGRLQPLIHQNYRTDTDDQAIFGDSTGGNFVGFTLFTRPRTFSKYLIASPGFTYNNFEVIRLEEVYAANHQDLDALVYIAATSGELFPMANGNIVSTAARLAETLHQRGYPSLTLKAEIIADKTHYSGAVDIYNRALALCWPGRPYSAKGEHSAEAAALLDGEG